MELRKKTVKGISWAIASQLIRISFNLLVTVILARLLTPEDFGLIAMAAVFINFFGLFNELGLSSALIQKKETNEVELSSAFWVNLIESVVVTTVFFVLAPVIAGFYSSSELKTVIMALSMTFTISSVGVIQSAAFSRQMDFKSLAIIEISGSVVAGIVAVVLAATGCGVWSLVFQVLVNSLVVALLLFLLSSWKPKLIMKWHPLKKLLGFSLPLMGFNFVNYFSRNLDNLLIGKYLGPSQLGYYDIAYKSLLFPLTNFSTVIGRVMFPALSHLEDDKARVREAYIKATRHIAVVTFPLTAGLVVLAPELVNVFLGAKWERAIFLVQVLAAIGGLQSIYTTQGWIYLSQGRTGVMLRVGIMTAVVFSSSFIIGLHWNVEGVAVAYAVAFTLMVYPTFAIPFRLIGMRFSYYVRQFVTITLSMLGMVAIMVGTRLLLGKAMNLGDLPVLVIVGIAGALSYLALILLLDRELATSFIRIYHDLRSSAPPD